MRVIGRLLAHHPAASLLCSVGRACASKAYGHGFDPHGGLIVGTRGVALLFVGFVLRWGCVCVWVCGGVLLCGVVSPTVFVKGRLV